jgi:hypothetical protein
MREHVFAWYSQDTPPPDCLEVHRSIAKLLLLTLCFLPFIVLSLLLPTWSVAQLMNGHSRDVLNVWHDMLFLFLVAALCCWRLGEIWVVYGKIGVIISVTPDGLVIPCLGSAKPIPWSRVKIRGWVVSGTLSFNLQLNVDPEEYPHLHGRTPFEKLIHAAGFGVIPVFDVKTWTLYRAIQKHRGL